MRRILLIVAMLLIAAPAMAKVTIRALDKGCGTVEVNYVCDSGTKVRAFALDIALDTNTVIAAIRDFNKGENDNNQHCGYGIFPGKFRDFINAAEPCWNDANYNPVAPVNDLDANTGLGTKAITVELGSLFVAGRDPCNSGILFNLDVRPAGNMPTKSAIKLTVNKTRGGVVDMNGNQLTGDTNVALVTSSEVNFPECFPCWSGFTFQYGQWVSMWKPRCWCGQYVSAGITGNGNNWRTQCQGDADGKYENNTYKYRVYTSDYNKLVAGWAKKATVLKSMDPNMICTDFDHQFENNTYKYRVYTSDYTKLVAGWTKKETILKPWCPRPL